MPQHRTKKVYVTGIYQEPLTNWLNQWKTLKLIVNWATSWAK